MFISKTANMLIPLKKFTKHCEMINIMDEIYRAGYPQIRIITSYKANNDAIAANIGKSLTTIANDSKLYTRIRVSVKYDPLL